MKVLDTKAKFHYGHNRSTTEGKQLYGGFSQYMYIEPGARLYKIPDGLPNDMACFTEVMCVAYTPEKARAVSSFDLEGVNLGDRAAARKSWWSVSAVPRYSRRVLSISARPVCIWSRQKMP